MDSNTVFLVLDISSKKKVGNVFIAQPIDLNPSLSTICISGATLPVSLACVSVLTSKYFVPNSLLTTKKSAPCCCSHLAAV